MVGSLEDRSSWRCSTFLLPSEALKERTVVVRGDEGHHAADVLRVRPGETVRLIDGVGAEALARVEDVSRDGVNALIIDRREHARSDGIDLTVVQALLKGRSFDGVVRRCAELGVSEIVPLRTARAVGRLLPDEEPGRLARWRAVALAAVKQSRGVFLPRITNPCDLAAALVRAAGADLAVLAWEEEDGRMLRDVLRAVPGARRVLVIVGPEGGLTPEEVEGARAAGASPVGLGRRILRADWAAAAVAAMVSCELGDLLP